MNTDPRPHVYIGKFHVLKRLKVIFLAGEVLTGVDENPSTSSLSITYLGETPLSPQPVEEAILVLAVLNVLERG